MTPEIETAVNRAMEISEQRLRPRAEANDRAEGPPLENIRLLAEAGLLGFTTPARYGGLGATGAHLRRFTELLAAACGVTTFVQGQHQSAALLIAGGENDDLKRELLPGMASGKVMCGVAFSHVRRGGDPTLEVTEQYNGFRFDGVAPWVTGWGVMQEVVLAGTLPDRQILFAVAPLTPDTSMSVSPPMQLCAMAASGTVSIRFHGFHIPKERYLKTISPEQMAKNDLEAILGVTAQPFGVARASIDLLRANGIREKKQESVAAAIALENRLNRLRDEVEAWAPKSSDPRFKECALELRARAIEHGVRCAHAALASSGGRGNSLDHPAQRLFREAMFYTLTAQTPDVQRSTVRRIALSAESEIG